MKNYVYREKIKEVEIRALAMGIGIGIGFGYIGNGFHGIGFGFNGIGGRRIGTRHSVSWVDIRRRMPQINRAVDAELVFNHLINVALQHSRLGTYGIEVEIKIGSGNMTWIRQ
ncbi:hypothetical protein BLOT_010149 [Blomia tropicalis]|nr:hypothetical protein BLOT_010149 [Blomia tropicalis]